MTPLPHANFAGVRVDALTTAEMLERFDAWLADKSGRARHVACMNAYCVSLALRDPDLRRIYNRADLALPDSMPFVRWIRRFVRAECDLLWGKNVVFAIGEHARTTSYTVFLYGGTTEACEGTHRRRSVRCRPTKIASSAIGSTRSHPTSSSSVSGHQSRTSGSTTT
jgi:UDP-N-acetyl-D-mannosaminuronic acid transferase (WecB/TagA/CpsF family)